MLGKDALYRKSSEIARDICFKGDGLPGIASSILQIQTGYQRLWVRDIGLTGRFANQEATESSPISVSQVILAIEPWLRGNHPYSIKLEEDICGLLGFRVHFLARLLV